MGVYKVCPWLKVRNSFLFVKIFLRLYSVLSKEILANNGWWYKSTRLTTWFSTKFNRATQYSRWWGTTSLYPQCMTNVLNFQTVNNWDIVSTFIRLPRMVLSTGFLYEKRINEILIEIHTFPFTKMRLKVSLAKWWPFCLGLIVLRCVHRQFSVGIYDQYSWQDLGWWHRSNTKATQWRKNSRDLVDPFE